MNTAKADWLVESRDAFAARIESPAKWILVLLMAGAAFWFAYGRETSLQATYVTESVSAEDITTTIKASGSLEARRQVNVGTELSGRVVRVHFRENDAVKAGDVLAMLDTSRLDAQLQQARSALLVADARLLQRYAGLKEASAKYARLQHARELSCDGLPSLKDLDLAAASLTTAEAASDMARAAVALARANVETIRADLAKTEIRSPISGVVLARSIEPGQTVAAAALQTPVLFTLAQDLTKMELHVSVDEADLPMVHVRQEARFTVDAYPDSVFTGRVQQIHLASNKTRKNLTTLAYGLTSDVVVYETVLDVDNADMLLRPGMTAAAEIITGSVENAVVVPTAALRFTPETAPPPITVDAPNQASVNMALQPRYAPRWYCPRGEDGRPLGCVWVLENGKPALALFKIGVTDRSIAEVTELPVQSKWRRLAALNSNQLLSEAVARKLVPGMKVIVAENAPEFPRSE